MTFVEVVDRRGRVRARVRVARLPFDIGRGYDCDLILDDPHVDGLHARVERDEAGGLVLRDMDSTNGLAPDGGSERRDRIQLSGDGDALVRLGRTTLRFRPADHAVPDALPIVRRSPLAEWLLEHWSAALAVPAFCVAVLLFDELRKTTGVFEPAEALSTTAWGLLFYGVWIGAWALLNRLLRQRTRWVSHSTVAFLASVVYTATQWGFEWLRFLLPPIEPLQLADLFVTTALWGVVLFAHLTVMGVAQRPARIAIVGVGFAAILGLQLLDRASDDPDWVVTLPYWSRLAPLDPSWLRTRSPDAFFAAIPELEAELAELAQAQEDEPGSPPASTSQKIE